MASAIELIVNSYVQLGDRQILLDLREKLAQHLQGVVGDDVGKVLLEIENDRYLRCFGACRGAWESCD